jgi:membrane protein implicated in regulation of membrane protease activity
MDTLITLLEKLNLWAWWAIAGLLLLGEIFTGTTYLLWPAAAAFLTGIIALESLGVGWAVQVSVFAMMSLVLVWAGDRWVRPKLQAGADNGLNDRTERMRGQLVVATSNFSAARGRVRFDDSEWAAEMVDGTDPESGARLEVVDVVGVVLRVRAK